MTPDRGGSDADPLSDHELMAFLREIALGRACFDKPSGDFDPDRLTPVASLRLGLPPPPNAKDPAREMWRVLAVSRTRSGALPSNGIVTDMPFTGYNRLGLKGHMETSRNWSGAVIASPYRRHPFGLLIGSWRVPDFRVPGGTPVPAYACSTWIGFDGHRRMSRSLPQIGTVQQISRDAGTGGISSCIKAWWQWWWPGTTGPTEYPCDTFPIAVGDEIVASVFVLPKIGVLLNLLNATTGQPIFPVLATPPEPKLEPKALDAECILERPKPVNGAAKNFVVPNFDPTTFRCHAFLRGETRSRDMRGGRMIRMVHLVRDDQLETIAAPGRDGGQRSVTVRYRGH